MMAFNSYLLVLVACLSVAVNSMPAGHLLGDTDGFCSGEDTLKYKQKVTYHYDYSTNTKLWINDVSAESVSDALFTAKVEIMNVAPCKFLLRLNGAKLTGDSVNASADLGMLALDVSFQMNARGEIHSTLGFVKVDSEWSRNIKRGVLSALQTKSVSDLRQLEEGSDSDKSSTVYETDVLGRCRTTYELKEQSGSKIVLKKTKPLHDCTLNGNKKTSAVQFITYRNMPVSYFD
jgi:hypothetical protein